MKRLPLTLTVLVVFLMVLLPAPGRGATNEVLLQNNKFVPEDITIRAGESVTWRHKDGSTAHTVTEDKPGGWSSSNNCPAPSGDDCMRETDAQHNSFQRAFPDVGTVVYYCKIHSATMRGRVIVTAATTPTPAPTATPVRTPTPTPKPSVTPSPSASVSPSPTPSPSPSVSPSPTPSASPLATGGDDGGGRGALVGLGVAFAALASAGALVLFRLRGRFF